MESRIKTGNLEQVWPVSHDGMDRGKGLRLVEWRKRCQGFQLAQDFWRNLYGS
ncbi:hypothetical protein AA19596_1275 [Acetobacter fabarum DSM 19596]|nr:hypothetical protein AA19596_1275 [Acetobacter fabarum DSM 19596]